ncbi:MAG: arsenate reductase (glutaredoxin) [Rhodothermales bacterium]|nr:arsenate reductase (glutaredoxin) [Rhodothermales bacterium]
MKNTIYHNPACSKSRNTLALLRDAGIEPEIVLYLDTPPTSDKLAALIKAMAITPRELLRQGEAPFEELGLADPTLTDAQLIDAMVENPVLINRPIVETPKGVRLCRPPERVQEILD